MYISETQIQNIEEIIRTSTNKQDWWSIIPTIVSAATACVAIIISIYTAKKQNKIALYEKRLNCYLQFSELRKFVEFIAKSDNLPQNVSDKNDAGISKIQEIQDQYCRGHNLFVNQEFLRYRLDSIKRNVYIWDCLEKDQFMLTSLLFLAKHTEEIELGNVKSALSKLIRELFRQPASNIDPKIIREASATLVMSFSKVEFIADNLKKMLRL